MPSLLRCPPEQSLLEERIEAFERAFAADGTADLADFLPPLDHPEYRETLGELIRVEVELLWGRRTPRPLETYLARFPLLQCDAALLGGIAFEEYRQRVQSGENVTPEEYRRHFGVDLSLWPVVSLEPEGDELRTNALGWESMREAIVDAPQAETVSINDGSTLPEPGDLVLRRFRIKERLGKGAFGSVYLAERLDLFHRPVALKFLPGPSVEPEMLAQLIHENIVPIESAERFGEMLVICMPFRGRTTLQHVVEAMPRESPTTASTGRLFLSTLRERSGSRSSSSSATVLSDASTIRKSGDSEIIAQARTLAQLQKLAGMSHLEASLRITMGIASGLAHAHERDIVHRDLKPANVLLADDGTPMLLDFNLATQVRRDRPLDCVRMGGTFPYMAPEQIRAARDRRECYDLRSDLYSLGVVVFELLTGQLPFPKVKRTSSDHLNQMLELRRGPIPDPCRLNPAVPRSVADIIHKLLAFDPAERYSTASQVKEDIERHLADLPLKHARESSRRARFAKFRRRHPRLCTALTVGLAAALLLFLPAGMIAASQGYQAYRLRQTQRAEAKLLRDDSIHKAFDLVTLVHSRARDSRLFQLSKQRAEELVQRYGVEPGADWDRRPELSRLDDQERNELLSQMGEAFHVLSGAIEEHSRDTQDPAMLSQADRWRKLADDCFGKAGRPPLVAGKKPGPAPIRPSVLPDLDKLDDADLYRLACDLISEAQLRDALTALNELLQRKPDHFMAWYWKAGALDGLGNYPQSIAAWETAIALQPGFATCHYNLGQACYRARDFRRADRAFTEAFRLEPKLVNALVNRALCRSRMGQLELAERDLSEALDREAPLTVVYFLRADVRRKLGKTREANADFEQGMRQTPQDEWSYSTRGYYLAVQGGEHSERALEDLDQALQINPRNPAALNNRMVVLAQLGRLPAAIAAADTYLSYYPDQLPIRAHRAVFMAKEGDVAGATKEAEFCVKMAAGAPALNYEMGTLYAILSRKDAKYKTRALELLSAALANGFDRPELFRTDKDLEPLHGDERFTKLLAFAQAQAELKAKRVATP